jgi:copper(I)-binding protein
MLTHPVVVNGEQNNMFITVQNSGENNYTLVSASASYHDPAKDWKLVRNATVTKLNIPLLAGQNSTAPYRLNSECVF